MKDCTIVETLPSAKEYNRLRQSVGWGTYREDAIDDALPNSSFCVCAYLDGQMVGMARVIGDGGLVYYIQDVIVLPDFQGRGIGTRLMDKIMAYIREHAHHHAIIGLMAAKGKEPFYERYGFTRRPNDRLGSGMTIFWAGDRSA
jgi:GNAT superfamily N-acetyltransferase